MKTILKGIALFIIWLLGSPIYVYNQKTKTSKFYKWFKQIDYLNNRRNPYAIPYVDPAN